MADHEARPELARVASGLRTTAPPRHDHTAEASVPTAGRIADAGQLNVAVDVELPRALREVCAEEGYTVELTNRLTAGDHP